MKAGSAQAESCCVYVKPKKCIQHIHDILPKLFDCWADPVAHPSPSTKELHAQAHKMGGFLFTRRAYRLSSGQSYKTFYAQITTLES